MKHLAINNLNDAGFLYQPTTASLLLSSQAEQLFRKWTYFLTTLLTPYTTRSYLGSGFIDYDTLNTSDYSRNFPHQLIKVNEHTYLSPAACLDIYPMLMHEQINDSGFLITTACGRSENNVWKQPFRLQKFTMMELVLTGSAEFVDNRRDHIETALLDSFSKLKLVGTLDIATDAFFLGDKAGEKMMQKMKQLKKEYTVDFSEYGPVALFSINNHEDYFVKKFRLSTNKQAITSCIAFGLERLVAASLLSWGGDIDDWPEEFKI